MARLFLAVTPPPALLDAVAALPRPDEPGVRWTRRQHWHVTVRFLGECAVDDVVAALAGVALPVPVVDLGPRVSRLGRNVVCLPAAGLDALAAQVAVATAEVGEPPDPRPFRGHLTLARLRHRGACRLAGTAFDARFVPDALELIESTLGGADGPCYDTRFEFPLVGSSAA